MAQSASSVELANLPALRPPAGVVPDLDHPATRAVEAYIGIGVCIGIAVVFILLRLYVKAAITHQWGWDDAACVLGFICIVAHDICFFSLTGPGGGIGTHLYEIRLTRFTKGYIQTTQAALGLYASAAFFVKLSLFLLYLRLFQISRRTRRLLYGGIFACGTFYASSIISNCALCLPKPGEPNDDATWALSNVRCQRSSDHLAVAQGVFSALSDIFLLVVPIQLVFQLKLPFKRKIGVSAIFMVGIIAVACSLASLVYRIKLLHIVDTTWFSLPVWILSATEISTGIVCSSTPILAALFRTSTKPRKFQLPSFRLRRFSWFTSRGSGSYYQLFASKHVNSAEKAQFIRPSNSESQYMTRVEDERFSLQSQDTVKASGSVVTV